MKKVLNEMSKFSIALVLVLIYMWFFMSFAWSLDDMSTAEKVSGIVYGFAMVPMYELIKKLAGLH